MKSLLLGYGSIGQRHEANLRTLYPNGKCKIYDPAHGDSDWRKWNDMTPAYKEYNPDFAIIASPTNCHLEQMVELSRRGIPFLVEKPPCEEIETSKYRLLVDYIEQTGLKCAVGFQYRFHKQARKLQDLARTDDLSFIAQDDLYARYGATVGGTMASHAIDMALWASGPTANVDIQSDGIQFKGKVNHRGGGESFFGIRMDTGPRVSYVQSQRKRIDLDPDDSAYAKELLSFVEWVMGNERDSRLATLRDGLAVMEILERCQIKTHS